MVCHTVNRPPLGGQLCYALFRRQAVIGLFQTFILRFFSFGIIISLVSVGINLFATVCSDSEGQLSHRYHHNDKEDQVERQDGKADQIAQQSEQRRNKGRAHIGACHLDANKNDA